ncbi:MAG: hypothetical protein ACRCZU_08835 [Selenomonadaceae bacterium]
MKLTIKFDFKDIEAAVNEAEEILINEADRVMKDLLKTKNTIVIGEHVIIQNACKAFFNYGTFSADGEALVDLSIAKGDDWNTTITFNPQKEYLSVNIYGDNLSFSIKEHGDNNV